MIKYKIDILEALKTAGYSTYTLGKVNKLLPWSTIQKLREGNTKITLETLNVVCSLLHCQPGDLLEFVPDEKKDGTE